MASNRHYFYVLYCQDNSLYGGYTTDLERRLRMHQLGKGAKYTKVKKRHPLYMIYAEEWDTKQLAMRQEYQFKQLTRMQKEYYLNQNGVKNIRQQKCVVVTKSEVSNDSTTKLS